MLPGMKKPVQRVEPVLEGEVLGRGYAWSGGESYGAIRRVAAFAPDGNDFVVVGLGSNDPMHGMSAAQTVANLRWMIERSCGSSLSPAIAERQSSTSSPTSAGTRATRQFCARNARMVALAQNR